MSLQSHLEFELVETLMSKHNLHGYDRSVLRNFMRALYTLDLSEEPTLVWTGEYTRPGAYGKVSY